MKKDILMVAHFCSDFDGKGNNRFNYLANLLSDHDFDVELITSNFSHTSKEKRKTNLKPDNYKLTYINEPAYHKNISLKRFYSHFIMAKNFKKYLQDREKPDIIYCAVPSLDLAKVAAEYANKNNIRFIIDVQDLWPEAFMMVLNVPVLSKIIFTPLNKKVNSIYSYAQDIIAVSDTYVSRVEKVNKRSRTSQSVYIGTDLKKFDEISSINNKIIKLNHEFWIAYVGTLGSSYDISSVIKSMKLLNKKGYTNIKLIAMGDGPLKSKFENEANKAKINAKFTGKLDYATMVGILKKCDIAVNPIVGGSAASIINKHADYAAAALPVLNTQESQEYKKLIKLYNMGINCENEDPVDLAKQILYLYKNTHVRNEMSINSRRLAEEKFDRGYTYNKIVDIINQTYLLERPPIC